MDSCRRRGDPIEENKTSMRVLVRSTNWLGDAVINIPAIEALKKRDPSGHLTVLADPRVADVFRNHPAIDEIMVYDRMGKDWGLRGLWRVAKRIRSQGFDRFLVFPNSFRSALLPFLAQVPQRVGYPLNGRGFLLTERPGRPESLRRSHHVRYYLNLVGADRGDDFLPRVYVTDAEIARAKAILSVDGVSPEGPLLGLCPGATYGPAKRWFPERFAAVGSHFAKTIGAGAVIFGSEAEREIAAKVEVRIWDRVAELTGRTTVRELAALLSLCSAVVTNDTGTMHLAAAVGTPVVAIFGSTDPVATGPLGPSTVVVHHRVECAPCLKRTCPFGHLDCMKAVSAEEVIEVVERIRRRPGT
jgi:heptosyltransferase-2